MKVELIYDADCPNVVAARTQLLHAFSQVGIDAIWSEWDRASGESPEYARRFGSPTILVDGRDIVPDTAVAVASCCRLYLSRSGVLNGVPEIEQIASALLGGSSKAAAPAPTMPPGGDKISWRATMAAVPTVVLALLPKLTCAACWPAYAAMLSALGFGFFDYTAYLLPITVAALAATLVTLGWRAEARRGYGPFVLGVLAAVVHVVGKFALDSTFIAYAAVPILIGAAVWNAWPRMVATGSCASCLTTNKGVFYGRQT